MAGAVVPSRPSLGSALPLIRGRMLYGNGRRRQKEVSLSTLGEGKVGDFASAWEGEHCGHFWNVLHVGIGRGHFSGVCISGSNSHSSSIHPRDCGVAQVWNN